MRFGIALSQEAGSLEACDQVVAAIRASGIDPDAAFVYFTSHHAPDMQAVIERLWLSLDPQAIVGCSAEGVIGGDAEVERSPGLSVLVAKLPGVKIHPFHIARSEWRDLLTDQDALAHRLGAGRDTRAFLAMGDPFSTPTAQFLTVCDDVFPRVPLIGGMASAGQLPTENILVRNDDLYNEGLVGLSLSGPLTVDTLVSQGCRPFGRTWVITKASENVIQTLGGRPALTALRESVMEMPEPDRELLQRGLFVGQAISEYRESFGRGDFLVRNVMGVDEDSGSVAVGDYVRVGQTIQFHVRDAGTADEDLRLLLASQKQDKPAPAGALLFSCNGRGMRMFDTPGHDITAARGVFPGLPMGGFFAAGEFGPIGQRNFIHGHTASFALFRPADQGTP